jgi:hypothetical protein
MPEYNIHFIHQNIIYSTIKQCLFSEKLLISINLTVKTVKISILSPLII